MTSINCLPDQQVKQTDKHTSHSRCFAHAFHHLVIALTTQIQNVSKLTNQLLITAYMLLLDPETREFKLSKHA